MSITNETNKITYTGTPGVATYVIPFYFTEKTQIEVYLNNTLLVYSTAYSVVGENNSAGGTVTILTATLPGAADLVTVLRKIPLKQLNTFNEGGPFRAKTIEGMFDKTAMIDQQLSDELKRSVKFPISSSFNAQITGVPVAGAIIEINPGANGLQMGRSTVSLIADIDSKVAASQAARDTAVASKDNAALSASNASASASAATTSQGTASTAATNAGNSASAAASSATAANSSQTAANSSQSAAASSATAASSSQTAAASSATSASTSAANASTSATSATNSATNAAGSATSANNSAASASTSATNAANSSATLMAGTCNIGDPAVNGSWRITIIGPDLAIQTKLAGVWVEISRYIP